MSDRLYVLQTGSIVLSGTPSELESSDMVRRAYLGL
jgi:ABC-type branched-chain amino acid transport systems, ATPase component